MRQGQALIEYLIILGLIIAMGLGVRQALLKSIGPVWHKYSDEISAGCPGANEETRCEVPSQ